MVGGLRLVCDRFQLAGADTNHFFQILIQCLEIGVGFLQCAKGPPDQ